MRILICEDDALLLAKLRSIAKEAGFIAEGATDGQSGLAKVIGGRYDLLVTDIRMPGLTGIDLIGKIKEISPETKVVAITGHASLEYAVACLKHGASDFLVKPFSKDDFLDCLKNINSGLIKEADTDDASQTHEGTGHLTSRETEVLTWAKDGKNNWEIAQILNITEATAKYHMSNILKKLSVSNRAAAVARAIEEKLI